MLDDAKKLPNDPAALKGLVVSLASEVKHQALFIEKLKHQLAGMRQHRHSSKQRRIVARVRRGMIAPIDDTENPHYAHQLAARNWTPVLIVIGIV